MLEQEPGDVQKKCLSKFFLTEKTHSIIIPLALIVLNESRLAYKSIGKN
jgi:hypothetical protein